MNYSHNLVVIGFMFLVLTLAGFYLAYLYGHKTKKFRWSEYLAIVIGPLIFVLFLSFFLDLRILVLFVVGSAVGFIFEYIFGLTYHKVLNQRLWTYNRLSVGGYTSLLSIPVWGIGCVIFWFLGKMLGL